jgi:membrane protease YdiL (CAAX protease family)
MTSRFFFRLAIIVIVWYLVLTYLPQVVGTCMDGDCGFTTGEIAVSIAIPLVFFSAPIALEVIVYGKNIATALRDIGVSRLSGTGIRLAMIYLLPLLFFFPLFALMTNSTLELRPNWTWLVLSALLNNGLAEETMMRGYVFRHIREGRAFWRAAAFSTVYFAGYHLPLVVTAGPLIGIIGVIVAIPTGFLTAYIYERGSNTIWGPVLLHTVNNALAYIFVFPGNTQPIASSLYLALGIVASILMLLWAYRSGYDRNTIETIPERRAANA